jgi:ABC-type transporter Mla MlaB component
MAFRISQFNGHHSHAAVTLRLEGRLVRDCLKDLAQVCQSYVQQPGRLRLDLAGVTFIDDAGVAFLRQLIADHIAVVGASPFVRELLKERHS